MKYEPKLIGSATQDMVDRIQLIMLAQWGPDATNSFGTPISSRMLWTELAVQEASLSGTHVGSSKKVVTVTHELEVKEDMCNLMNAMHGGCTAFLVDICTTLAITVVAESPRNVSVTMNISYHAPALLGSTISVVSSTTAIGKRVMSARCEIWDKKKRQLVASGMHTKMYPSEAKL